MKNESVEKIVELVMEDNIRVQELLGVAFELASDYKALVFNKQESVEIMDESIALIRLAIAKINKAERIEGLK
jgi:hypothetical protein